ncbi:MAG: hypothetical protein KatS3mg038_1479 [Candidatus Kapaibacterium sp.]|nr:MAG: hypothetical protein KatS3mg038_1479 [Candidatus Kapabacteria bacterium]
MHLWRAAHNSRIFRGACFAQDRRDAEAYLDNPGFGGPRLFCVEVQPTRRPRLHRPRWRCAGWPPHTSARRTT